MNNEHIALGIRGIEDLEQRRDKLNNDIELWIVRIKTMDKEIKELTKILNNELTKKGDIL
jgi:chaperonin cofactor prefoldin